jgi:hypothetical protein
VPVTGTSNVTCFRCRHPPSYDCHRDLLERLQGTVRFQQDRYLCFDEGLTIRRRAFFRGNGVRPQPDNGTVIEADAPRLPVVRAARASCCLGAARGQIRAWMAAAAALGRSARTERIFPYRHTPSRQAASSGGERDQGVGVQADVRTSMGYVIVRNGLQLEQLAAVDAHQHR